MSRTLLEDVLFEIKNQRVILNLYNNRPPYSKKDFHFNKLSSDIILNCHPSDSCVCYINLSPFLDSATKMLMKKLLIQVMYDAIGLEITKGNLGYLPCAHTFILRWWSTQKDLLSFCAHQLEETLCCRYASYQMFVIVNYSFQLFI
jgi:hypothetical protein